jgi:adenosine deaminase
MALLPAPSNPKVFWFFSSEKTCFLPALFYTFLLTAQPAIAAEPQQHTEALFQQLRHDPLRLRAFLSEMPKGGDLHNHLDGAVYAETFLTHAAGDGLCIDIARAAIRPPPCTQTQPPAGQALADHPGLEDAMIDSLSMRDFVPGAGDASGHDHFFATFGKFAAAADDPAYLMVDEARRAAAEHIDYIETIWMRRRREAADLGNKTPWHGDDFASDLAAIAPDIEKLAAQAKADTDAIETRMRTTLGCATPRAEPACQVTLRYQAFSLRTLPPQVVFAQIALDFAIAQTDPRFVGVNIVAPEDDPVALRDYTLHMRMLRFFHQAHPEIKLSLHAGELAFGLVPPEDLRFHIRQAVEIAGASRIGHGVSVMYETDAMGLLAEMAQRHVAVEINQTSNAQILGVKGEQHPFAEYRAAGVPVVISTDDEGVERTDLTEEFLRAAETWHLGYLDLRNLALASITYSFLPEADKARAYDKLERELLVFEDKMSLVK